MHNRVLVAYASKNGGTAGIAEKIGKELKQAGLNTDVLSIKQIRDLDEYEAVVLGSAVYIGSWRNDAVRFLQSNEIKLADKKVWLFSSGPTGSGDAMVLTEGWRFPRKQQPIADRIHPQDIAIFHGVIDPNKINPIEKWMLKNVQAPIGDYRNWEVIGSWAAMIGKELNANNIK